MSILWRINVALLIVENFMNYFPNSRDPLDFLPSIFPPKQNCSQIHEFKVPTMLKLVKNWRERAAFQRSAFGRSTAGNDVVATIFICLFSFFFIYFFFPFFSPFFFPPPSRPFLIEGVLRSKNLFRESCLERPKT